jgi:hypothetical protein
MNVVMFVGHAVLIAVAALVIRSSLTGVDAASSVTEVKYHLTARPWAALATPSTDYLDVLEAVCRFSIRHQADDGAIIDPFLGIEHQYATPYFAFAVATLVNAGRARDLLPNGIRAMEHATAVFAKGGDAIPQRHGEFFIPALTESLHSYRPLVPDDRWRTWYERMKRERQAVVQGGVNNWETYAMKGEWLRQHAGLVPREDAISYIEAAWHERQRPRIVPTPYSLYHDRSSDPDTLSVEAVGRGNLLSLATAGYDGPSASEIRTAAEAGTRFSLLLQDPSGQAPVNGRTDAHVWVDVGYQLAFELMAERAFAAGDLESAGRFRRAALLAFRQLARWRRTDNAWAGSYYVTKNRFDPSLRVGYQNASQYSNYNGSLMFHLAEAFGARKSVIDETPAPSEIGGYAFELDQEYAAAFANAGGMQVQANLRGEAAPTAGNSWTPLGLVRFARSDWDTRLGPSDGALTATDGVSFAPEFEEGGRWIRMAAVPQRYEAAWSVEFVHPALVRCAITYRPKAGEAGPTFRDDLIITPSGVLSSVRREAGRPVPWAVTWPVLENDGRPLQVRLSRRHAETSYPHERNRQAFIAIDGVSAVHAGASVVRSTYGDLRPVRAVATGDVVRTFVYPHTSDEPSADAVRRSLRMTNTGFRSIIGSVIGTVFIGPTVAGGEGLGVDLNDDGRLDVVFDRRCGFLLQLKRASVVAIEVDRSVRAEIQGRTVELSPFQPIALTRSSAQN